MEAQDSSTRITFLSKPPAVVVLLEVTTPRENDKDCLNFITEYEKKLFSSSSSSSNTTSTSSDDYIAIYYSKINDKDIYKKGHLTYFAFFEDKDNCYNDDVEGISDTFSPSQHNLIVIEDEDNDAARNYEDRVGGSTSNNLEEDTSTEMDAPASPPLPEDNLSCWFAYNGKLAEVKNFDTRSMDLPLPLVPIFECPICLERELFSSDVYVYLCGHVICKTCHENAEKISCKKLKHNCLKYTTCYACKTEYITVIRNKYYKTHVHFMRVLRDVREALSIFTVSNLCSHHFTTPTADESE